MLNFPIKKLIRILNSPKRFLNNHHILFEFIKKFIVLHEKKLKEKQEGTEYEEENLELLMSSLDYDQMSNEELQELFNSKYFNCSFSCKGAKEQMS